MASSLEFLIKARDATAQAFHSAKKNMADMADAGGKATGSTERFLKLSPQMMAMGAAVAGVGLVMHDVYKASGDLQKGASSLGDGWSRLMATMADTAVVRAAGDALDWLGGKLTQFSNWLGDAGKDGKQQQLSQREWDKILKDSDSAYAEIKKAEESSKRQSAKLIDDQKKADDDLLSSVFKAAAGSKEENLFNLMGKKKKTKMDGTGAEFVGPEIDALQLEVNRYQEVQDEKAAIKADALEKEFQAAVQQEAQLDVLYQQQTDKRIADEKRVADAKLALQQSYLNSTGSLLGSLSALVDGKNKQQFNAAKMLARGQVIVDTFAAAQKAAASTPGPPGAQALAAAAATAAGLARLKAINSTSYGGGGGISSTSAGGGAGTIPNGIPTGPVQGQKNAQQVLQIQFTGNVYGLKDFEDRVVEAVKNASDKDVVIISNNTAQAREIMRA